MNEFLLSELLVIKNGRDHQSLDDGLIPVFGSGGLMRYVNKAIYEHESILLPRKGSLGNIQFANQPFWTVDTLYYTIVNKEKVSPFYLFNYLRSMDLSNLNSGTGVPSMTFSSYYDLKIQLPDLTTQKKIASVLSALDDKIELNNRINSELEAMAKLLYEYWFVQFDFPYDLRQSKPADETSKPQDIKPYKSSGGKMIWNKDLNREIPEGWGSENIMEIADFFGGGTPKTSISDYWNGEFNFYTPADYEQSVFSLFTKERITKKGLDNCSSRLFPKGTIFITARGSVGKINIASDFTAMNQSCYALSGKGEMKYPFVFQHVTELVNYIKAKASGSIFNALVTNDFKFTKLPTPPLNLIEEYNNQTIELFERILLNKIQNQVLSSLRDWLLPMLMNGQVTVEDAEERVNEELGMVAEEERGRYGKK
jgi:type I restriction enzyme S subunit